MFFVCGFLINFWCIVVVVVVVVVDICKGVKGLHIKIWFLCVVSLYSR